MDNFDIQIIFHDDDIIIAEKPSMLLSVPGRGIEKYDSVSTRLEKQFKEVHIVHRLDWEKDLNKKLITILGKPV